MAERLIINSIDTDNRIVAQFSDKFLPRVARHGELYVINGILYIYADLDDKNQGKWFPLTNQKEIYTFETLIESDQWEILVDFYTDNIDIIIYDNLGKVYQQDYQIARENNKIILGFDAPFAGEAHIIVNKSFDIIERRLIIGDRNLAMTEDIDNPNTYYFELDTKHLTIDQMGLVTFKGDVVFEKSVLIPGFEFNNSIQVNGDVLSDNISILTTKVNTIEMIIESNDLDLDTIQEIVNFVKVNRDLIGVNGVDWTNILNKPDAFKPEYHEHAMSEIINLESTLGTFDDFFNEFMVMVSASNNNTTPPII